MIPDQNKIIVISIGIFIELKVIILNGGHFNPISDAHIVARDTLNFI